MMQRFFDPMGRECSGEAFDEWSSRHDVHVVREYAGTAWRVLLRWNPIPHDTFGDAPVFKIEVLRPDTGAGGDWMMDRVMSGASFQRLSEAIDGYQKQLVDMKLATFRPDGSFDDTGNKAVPTTHELEFTEIDTEESEEEVSAEFEMPELTSPIALTHKPQTDHVGTGFAGMSDGGEEW